MKQKDRLEMVGRALYRHNKEVEEGNNQRKEEEKVKGKPKREDKKY